MRASKSQANSLSVAALIYEYQRVILRKSDRNGGWQEWDQLSTRGTAHEARTDGAVAVRSSDAGYRRLGC